MSHPNVQLLTRFYEALAKNDVSAALSLCADEVTFQVAGKSKLAGKFNRSTVGAGLFDKMTELGGGTFTSDIHDITATDQHGMVLMTNTVTRDGKKHEYRTVHVWRMPGGKLVAWYEYPRDMYQYDAIWS